MKSVLGLNATQEERVLIINVINFSLLKKLRESNQTSQIPQTKKKYRAEIKEVLNSDQYATFLQQFGDL
jgi:DNA recombination-dependent growth factor C